MEIHYKRQLKKLNQIDENEKVERKKYLGKKIIKQDLEDKIEEAIDNLKYNNNGINKTNKNLELKQVNILTSSNKNLFSLNKYHINHNGEKYINLNSDILKYQLPIQNSVTVEHKINSKLNSVNNQPQIQDKINNNFRFFNENYSNTNFNNHINNVNNIRTIITNLNNYTNYSNNEHIINNNKENQNNSGFLPIFPIIQDFNQIDKMIDYENNIDLFKKINDISTCFTRPCSDSDLFIEEKANDIFVKDADLLSEEEFPKNSNCKFINDHSNINETINKDYNSSIYADQQGFFNEQTINKSNYKFNEMNGYKDIQKYQYFD
jgi:hypothetical protein